MEQMIYERSGLLGFAIAILVPAIAFWLKSKTTQAAEHSAQEDQQEGDIRRAYVTANERRDTQFVSTQESILISIRNLNAAIDGLPAAIRKEFDPLKLLVDELNQRLDSFMKGLGDKK